MCISDWRIGRLIRAVPSTVIVPTMGSVTIRANPQRVGIDFILSGDSPNQFTGMAITQAGVDLTSEAVVPYRPNFRVTTHGDLPTKEFVVSNFNGSNSNVSVIEYFLPESVLAEPLENTMRNYP